MCSRYEQFRINLTTNKSTHTHTHTLYGKIFHLVFNVYSHHLVKGENEQMEGGNYHSVVFIHECVKSDVTKRVIDIDILLNNFHLQLFFFLIFYFGSCGRLSWLNRQLSSACEYKIITSRHTPNSQLQKAVHKRTSISEYCSKENGINTCKVVQEAQLMLTNLCDAFIGQSMSPNIAPFHMLGIVSYCAIVTLSLRLCLLLYSTSKCRDLENRVSGPSRSLEISPFDRAHTTCY